MWNNTTVRSRISMIRASVGKKHNISYNKSDWKVKPHFRVHVYAFKRRASAFGSSRLGALIDILWSWGLKKSVTPNGRYFNRLSSFSEHYLLTHLNDSPSQVSGVRDKHFEKNDDNGGKLNTVRFTGKPADNEGKRNPGVEQARVSVFLSTSSESRTGGHQCRTR